MIPHMKTALFFIALTSCLTVIARSEIVELTAGPALRVTPDPAIWKLAEPVQKAEEGASQSARWKLQHTEWAEITLVSHRAHKTESEYKEGILGRQKLRGDPAELVRERRESLAARDWLVLEFRNRHTRPTRSEIHYSSQLTVATLVFL